MMDKDGNKNNNIIREPTEDNEDIRTREHCIKIINGLIRDLRSAQASLKDCRLLNKSYEDKKMKLTKAIEHLEVERKNLKSKQWCFWCLNEANFICCFEASYCSEECRKQHFYDGHRDVCSNPSLEKESTNN